MVEVRYRVEGINIEDSGVLLSDVFNHLANLVSDGIVKDFTLTRTNLEQVFINLRVAGDSVAISVTCRCVAGAHMFSPQETQNEPTGWETTTPAMTEAKLVNVDGEIAGRMR